MDTFVSVYAVATGRKQDVPEHWLDDSVIGPNFRKTPLTDKQQREADAALAKATTTSPGDGE